MSVIYTEAGVGPALLGGGGAVVAPTEWRPGIAGPSSAACARPRPLLVAAEVACTLAVTGRALLAGGGGGSSSLFVRSCYLEVGSVYVWLWILPGPHFCFIVTAI